MRMNVKSILMLGLGVATTVTLAAQGPMRPGNWETTVKMEMAGMSMQMPEMKNTNCVTAEQLQKDPATGLPNMAQDPRSGCKVSDYKTTGNTVSWKMACPAPASSTGTGELTFSGDTFTGTMKMSSPGGEMTMKMAGKRLGDCTQ
jgi:hypothetical protein